MENSVDFENPEDFEWDDEDKLYIPVHAELKQFPGVEEFYSVPKRYNDMMEGDMKLYGNFIEAIRSQSAIWTESTFLILRDRIDEIWKLYLNALHEGVSAKRVHFLRDSMRKIMYSAQTYTALRRSLDLDDASVTVKREVVYRRIHFIMTQVEQIVEETKDSTGPRYDEWEKRFVRRIHQID
jgi:hypothetical protein